MPSFFQPIPQIQKAPCRVLLNSAEREGLEHPVITFISIGYEATVSRSWLTAAEICSELGFKSIDLISDALGDRPEPVAMFLPIGQVAAAVKEAKSR